jgi:hypothetical protein
VGCKLIHARGGEMGMAGGGNLGGFVEGKSGKLVCGRGGGGSRADTGLF